MRTLLAASIALLALAATTAQAARSSLTPSRKTGRAQLVAWLADDKLSKQEDLLWKKLRVPACANL